MESDKRKAFQIADEPSSTLSAYGDSEFGRGCLMARRLIESGVRFVEVTLDGWDTHKDNFTRTSKLMGALDPAAANLIKDLKARSLLDSTLVICMGEFGRTPTINGTEGRDHYPQAWSAVMAGGGVRGGTVVGETDALGGKVVKDPIAVPDFFASTARLLGLNPATSKMTATGRPISITEKGTPVRAITG